MPMNVNINRVRGDTYPINITFSDNEGNPIDITGATIAMGYKDKSGNLVQINGEVVSGPEGKARILPNDASFPNVGNFKYDIQLITSEGYKITVISGFLVISDDVLP